MKSSLPLLDLHGYVTADVPDAVDRFLMTSMRKGAKRVRIMTGKGSGQVRKVVTDYLRKGGYPFEQEKLPGGGRNEGVLVVFLDD
jgi:DNA-nicking Smr family endonuclease